MLERALTVNHLSQQALSRGKVQVGLHPHTPDRLPSPLGDQTAHLVEQFGRVLAHPVVVLGLAVREHDVGVATQQVHGVGERSHRLATRLANGPQPRRIEVRVAGRDDSMTGARSGRVEHRRNGVERGVRGGRNVGRVDGVADALEGVEQSSPNGIGVGRVEDQVDDRLHPQGQFLDRVVLHRDVGPTQHVQRSVRRGGGVPQRCRSVSGGVTRDHRRGRRLDPDLDDVTDGALPQIDQTTIGLHRVHDPTVHPGDGLGLEPVVTSVETDVDRRHETSTRMALVDGVREAEPRRVPGTPPRRARGHGTTGGPHRFGVARRVESLVDGLDAHRHFRGQDVRPDSL
ncbi:unannotated protein [freshwater metagenome]|uniref:Unannotated protein n=1 Tax=freshwater metagenome TaxID=449393 RepID=A0A6J6G938_9ZZZZ